MQEPSSTIQNLALPADWDFARDVVLLVGADLEQAVEAFLERKQERLILFYPGEGEPPPLRYPVQVVRTRAEIVTP